MDFHALLLSFTFGISNSGDREEKEDEGEEEEDTQLLLLSVLVCCRENYSCEVVGGVPKDFLFLHCKEMGNSPEKGVVKPPGQTHGGSIFIRTATLAFVLVGLPLLLWSTGMDRAAMFRYQTGSNSTNSHQDDGYYYYFTTITAASTDSSPPPTTTIPMLFPVDRTPTWLSVQQDQNYTSTLLSRWLAPGGEPCRDSKATDIFIHGLDGGTGSSPSLVELASDEVHEFVFSAIDETGRNRCLGGDYFETDLSGESWKSRPPVTDHGNGTYSVYLQVHHDFTGFYNFTIVLLFRSFNGLKFSPSRFAYRKEIRRFSVKFHNPVDDSSSLPELQHCRPTDFSKDVWTGRWTRHGRNDSCEINRDGRYRCLDYDYPCRSPWCHGPLGPLESNGWVYSSHCSFEIYRQEQAWRCLRGKWLFFWGDSNHVDTIRNLLNFVLGIWDIKSVPRRFDERFRNPTNRSESLRITSLFNGHWNETMNYLGLDSLRNDGFRDIIKSYLSKDDDEVPDSILLNSGLHDGVHFKSVRAFKQAAEYASDFWEEILRQMRVRTERPPPKVFYRTTIATGGYARDLAFNPNKMEVFNGIMVEKLRRRGVLDGGGVVDEFDMTFPWHYDNRCNDGVHYGRAPAKAKWKDGEIGHQYFVDLMLAHVLLNAVCGG